MGRLELGTENDPEGSWYIDSSDNIVLELDDGSEALSVDQSGNITGISSLTAGPVSAESVNIAGVTPDHRLTEFEFVDESSDQTTTSTTYEGVLTSKGVVYPSDLSSQYTLYARYTMRIGNNTAGETTFSQPQLFDFGGSGTTQLPELEVSVTGNTTELVNSGWTEITTSITGPLRGPTFLGRVSGGTGTFEWDSATLEFGGVVE